MKKDDMMLKSIGVMMLLVSGGGLIYLIDFYFEYKDKVKGLDSNRLNKSKVPPKTVKSVLEIPEIENGKVYSYKKDGTLHQYEYKTKSIESESKSGSLEWNVEVGNEKKTKVGGNELELEIN